MKNNDEKIEPQNAGIALEDQELDNAAGGIARNYQKGCGVSDVYKMSDKDMNEIDKQLKEKFKGQDKKMGSF